MFQRLVMSFLPTPIGAGFSVNKVLRFFTLFVGVIIMSACSLNVGDIAGAVPTTDDTSSDPSAVQQFLPTIPGYTATDADSIVDAISAVGGSASLITGNPVTAALIAQIDGMIQCYQQVGAVGAKIYTQADIGQILEGQLPTVGALAMINQNRVANNFLPCALGGMSQFSAQAVQPCSSSGQFVVNNETILYVYGATTQALCDQFNAYIPG